MHCHTCMGSRGFMPLICADIICIFHIACISSMFYIFMFLLYGWSLCGLWQVIAIVRACNSVFAGWLWVISWFYLSCYLQKSEWNLIPKLFCARSVFESDFSWGIFLEWNGISWTAKTGKYVYIKFLICRVLDSETHFLGVNGVIDIARRNSHSCWMLHIKLVLS